MHRGGAPGARGPAEGLQEEGARARGATARVAGRPWSSLAPCAPGRNASVSQVDLPRGVGVRGVEPTGVGGEAEPLGRPQQLRGDHDDQQVRERELQGCLRGQDQHLVAQAQLQVCSWLQDHDDHAGGAGNLLTLWGARGGGTGALSAALQGKPVHGCGEAPARPSTLPSRNCAAPTLKLPCPDPSPPGRTTSRTTLGPRSRGSTVPRIAPRGPRVLPGSGPGPLADQDAKLGALRLLVPLRTEQRGE